VKSQQERAAARREEKLEDIRQQIADGTLVVRQMTDEERKQNPPRKRQPRNKRR
jgi:anti-sigma28 factor (negative regulator of flagellin synthesis)